MESRHLAGAIGLIFFSAGVAMPVKGHSADLLGGIGSIAKEVIRLEGKKKAISTKQKAATSANEQSATKSPNETLRTQQALKAKGYSPGPIDGIDGEQTRAAIRAYQRANGWPETGILTAAQRAQLFGLGTPGAAAVATGLLPLLLDNRGSSAAGTAATVQERKTTTVSTDADGETTNDLSLRRKSRLATGDGGTASFGTTATVTEGQNLNTTAGDSQQSLKSLLTTSTQPSGDESTTTNERKRATSRTANSVDSTTETLTRQRRTTVGDAAAVGASRRAGTGNAVTDVDCTEASRRNRECVPTR